MSESVGGILGYRQVKCRALKVLDNSEAPVERIHESF